MIELKNLTLKVPGKILVADLNCKMNAGERWCILGKNGSGKSTLLKTIAGLRPNDSGEIFWEDQDINKIPQIDLAKIRAFSQQIPIASDDWSVFEIVKSGAWPWVITKSVEQVDFEEKLNGVIHQALFRCDISHLVERRWKHLSGGERARVALASCLAQTTKALILDEPTAHLDLGHQFKLMDDLVEASKSCDQLLVSSIHDLQIVSRGFTHVLILGCDEQGSWISGKLEDVLTPQNIEMALGHPVTWVDHEHRKVLIAL